MSKDKRLGLDNLLKQLVEDELNYFVGETIRNIMGSRVYTDITIQELDRKIVDTFYIVVHNKLQRLKENY